MRLAPIPISPKYPSIGLCEEKREKKKKKKEREKGLFIYFFLRDLFLGGELKYLAILAVLAVLAVPAVCKSIGGKAISFYIHTLSHR
jgi:hypothetical protein